MIAVGLVVADHEEGLPGIAQRHAALTALVGLDRDHAARLGTFLPVTEVLLGQAFDVVGLDVADETDDHVARHVVALVELQGLLAREVVEIAAVADERTAVGMTDVGHGQELFDHATDRRAVGAHATLFDHHVALGVELAHDGIDEALALEVGPELELVARHLVEVGGDVVAGRGVEAGATVLLDDVAEFVGHHEFARLVLRRRELGLEFFQPRVVGEALVLLGEDLGVDLVDLLHRLALFAQVLGPDLVGSLEGHVLEHVRQAGTALFLVHAADADLGEVGEHGRARTFDHDESQAVVQSERLDLGLESRDVLRAGRRDQRRERDDESETGQHESVHGPSFVDCGLHGGRSRDDFRVHREGSNGDERRGAVVMVRPAGAGRVFDTHALSGSKKRRGRSAATRIPIRPLAATSAGAAPGHRPSRVSFTRSRPSHVRSVPRACPSLPGPLVSSTPDRPPRRAASTSWPASGSAARSRTAPATPGASHTTFSKWCRP